jgi:hypothetical protein
VELKNVNPNGDIVVASNLNNVNLFFENREKWVHKLTSYMLLIPNKCHDGPKIKNPHIVHITIQY